MFTCHRAAIFQYNWYEFTHDGFEFGLIFRSCDVHEWNDMEVAIAKVTLNGCGQLILTNYFTKLW